MPSINVAGAVNSFNATLLTGNHNIYTPSSNQFAIVQVQFVTGGGTGYLTVGGIGGIFFVNPLIGLQKNTFGTIDQSPRIYIGPNKTLTFSVTAGAFSNVSVTGVVFGNI